MNRLIVPPLPAASRPRTGPPAAAGVLYPVLQLEQLDLEQTLEPVVLRPVHPLVVGIFLPPGVDHAAVQPHQDGIVVVIVPHPQIRQLAEQVAASHGGAHVKDRKLSVHRFITQHVCHDSHP
ncbi:hypothetical protein ACFQX6_23220 [Streptosporangium lutulentum]